FVAGAGVGTVAGAGGGWSSAVLVGTVLGGTGALVESWPTRWDDNLILPIALAVLLGAGLAVSPAGFAARVPELLERLPAVVAVNVALAALAWRARHVDRSGAVAGFFLSAGLGVFGGWGAFLLFVIFFAMGTAATRFGREIKEARRVAQEDGGRRSVRHAVANVGVPALLAVIAAGADVPFPFLLAVAGAIATAAFDTVSSEVGQVVGKRTVLITTLRPVAVGTEGGISLEGTLAGLAAAVIVAGAAVAGGLVPAPWAAVVVMAAVVGGMFESLLGAWAPTRRAFGNEALNFLNTAAGAGLCLVIALVRGS
ncbi:MAG: DUF92 domain-containing protein, partial [Gemmatimonadetes bacterium]|nr:DUF92 domain-containing protein [Gemmatimonadota bacterium]